MPIPFNRNQTAANAQRTENTIHLLNQQITQINRDIQNRKITDVESAKQAIALKEAKIKDLRSYQASTPVEFRDSKNRYRTFSVPYTATSKVKPAAKRPQVKRRVPKKGSPQSRAMIQQQRMRQSRAARAPRNSISSVSNVVKKPKVKVDSRIAAMRRKAAMRRMSRRRWQPRGRKSGRENQRSQTKSREEQRKDSQAEEERLRKNSARRRQQRREEQKQQAQSQQRSRTSRSRSSQSKKSQLSKRFSRYRSNRSRRNKASTRRNSARKRRSNASRRLGMLQSNIGAVRRDDDLAEEMRKLQHELAMATHEENQLTALIGRLDAEAMALENVYADEENIGLGSAWQYNRHTKANQHTSGNVARDTTKLNAMFAQMKKTFTDMGMETTPAWDQLVARHTKHFNMKQHNTPEEAVAHLQREFEGNPNKYVQKTLSQKQQVQQRQLGMLTVQKNRISRSVPNIQAVTAERKAFYEQQRVLEEQRQEAAREVTQQAEQMAGLFPRTRSAMERMTR
jgi:hypothetical protein